MTYIAIYQMIYTACLHSEVKSSADLFIEATRSIFHFLETAVHFWDEKSVWVVAHYALMAAMPLFLDIIIHPFGNPADSDLRILALIGDITQKIPTERLSAEEIEYIQEVSEFVMQLTNLSHNAAFKAKKGERDLDLDVILVLGKFMTPIWAMRHIWISWFPKKGSEYLHTPRPGF